MSEQGEVMNAAHLLVDLLPEHGGRLTDRVEFAWVFGPETEDVDPSKMVAERVVDAGEDPTDLGAEGRWGEAGRGWSTDALLLVLGGGILVTNIIAAFNDWDEFIRKVARLWRRLRGTSTPMLSLGAVKLLCLADLAQRGCDVRRVGLLFAGDVGGGVHSDLSYSGRDLFVVLFSRDRGGFFLYLVDSTGRLLHFAKGDAYQPDVEDSEVSGWDVEDRSRLPFLLDSATDSAGTESADPGSSSSEDVGPADLTDDG